MSSEAERVESGHAETTRRVAVAWLDAVTSCDVPSALALSAPSIVYTHGGHLRHYEGHAGIRDIIEDFSRLCGFVTYTVLSTVAQPGLVAISRQESYTLPAGGVEIPACSFVEVADGLVTRWADYKDLRPLDQITA